MQTETAAQRYWEASLAWRGKTETTHTFESLCHLIAPCEIHRSLPLARQASELSDMMVKMKRARCNKPRKKLQNLVTLPTRSDQKTKAA